MAENSGSRRRKDRERNKAKAIGKHNTEAVKQLKQKRATKAQEKAQGIKKAIKKLTPAQKKKAIKLMEEHKKTKENQEWLKKSKQHKQKNYA
jgi:hypothetical protein